MHIERIEISGFKGISSLEFEPGQLNLITGANNSGKTSLLEAVELAFDPTKVEKYGERVEDLVHVDFEEAEISVEYREKLSNQKLSETKAQNLRISNKNTNELINPISRILSNIHKETGKIKHIISGQDMPDVVASTLAEAMAEAADQVSNQYADSISSNRYSSVTIHSRRDSHQFVHIINVEQLRSEMSQEYAQQIIEYIVDSQGDVFEDDQRRQIEQMMRVMFQRLFSDGNFLDHGPETIREIEFYSDPVKLTQDDIDLDEENAAVRLSDIEDYLKEHDLVENLDTLSFDQMVYEEDGEKYQVPYEFTGDGFKTLLGLLWELSGDEDEILLLEEPENHMHPQYIHEFVYWLVGVVEDQDVQMLLTTHDIDFIRSFFDFVDAPQKQFLSENFRLLKMDQTMPEVYDYDDAEELSKELQMDLRGI